MKELTVLLEKLAGNLGTTVEKLWGALLKQAPISGVIDLIVCIALAVASILLFTFVQKKTTPQKDDVYPDWGGEGKFFAWIVTGAFVSFSVVFILLSLESIISAFFNPEYWALTKILSKVFSCCKCK